MNTAPAGFFSPQVNGMDASNKLPFFPAGFIGDVEVIACKGITTRAGERAFIAELRVLSSNMPDTVRLDGKYSWFQGLKEPGTAYPACIGFLYACLGLDQSRDKEKIDTTVKPRQDAYLNMAVNEDLKQFGGKINILAGAKVRVQTATKKTKAGADFTVHNFSPVPKAA
jgi:hypothetical protein